jgi:hypothetical protein
MAEEHQLNPFSAEALLISVLPAFAISFSSQLALEANCVCVCVCACARFAGMPIAGGNGNNLDILW